MHNAKQFSTPCGSEQSSDLRWRKKEVHPVPVAACGSSKCRAKSGGPRLSEPQRVRHRVALALLLTAF